MPSERGRGFLWLLRQVCVCVGNRLARPATSDAEMAPSCCQCRLPAAMKKCKQMGFVVLAIQVFALTFYFSQLGNENGPQEKEPTHVHVLIVSSWRSGSSFVGQLFSQHPDVFYLMEPAWHVWSTMPENNARVLQMPARDLVRAIFQCDMSVFDVYLPAKRTTSSIFMWETSRALCSPPACTSFQRSDFIPKQACRMLCGKHPFGQMEEACKTYSHVVLKEVRFFDLRVLYPLLADPNLNLRIIHLVRDPRAVLYSRSRTSTMLDRDNKIVARNTKSAKMDANVVMEEVCRSHVKIYMAGRRILPCNIQDRYRLVRYEDIAIDPLGEVAELYKFVGLSFTPRIQQWVYNMTRGKDQRRNPFDTSSRDALKTSFAWRTNLSYPDVAKLQDYCREAMALLGYQLVGSMEDQKNLSFSLLHPWKPLSRQNNEESGKASSPSSDS